MKRKINEIEYNLNQLLKLANKREPSRDSSRKKENNELNIKTNIAAKLSMENK